MTGQQEVRQGRQPIVNRDNLHNFVAKYGAPENLAYSLQREGVKSDLRRVATFLKTSSQEGENNAVDFLNFIYLWAARQNYSDLHFSSVRNGTMVRIRDKQGVMYDIMLLQNDFMKDVELKIRAKCNISLTDMDSPHDSSFFLEDPETQEIVDYRVSFVPTKYGQNIVNRVLRQNDSFRLETMYLASDVRPLIYRVLNENQGLVLISGPTGSGKSTTLFCFLQEKNTPEVNIMTAEDPIEYSINGANQVGINQFRPFAKVLRSFLRQDPDIIMVGELRDEETANITMQAANTGHLVFGTIHTNDAAQIINRLVLMGADRFATADALLAFTAQRLARKLCPHCRELRELDDEQMKTLPTRYPSKRYYVANRQGCGHEGCNCGFVGKIPVMEFALNTAEVKQAIMKGQTDSIQEVLQKQPQYRTLQEEALRMSSEGLVDMSEAVGIAVNFGDYF